MIERPSEKAFEKSANILSGICWSIMIVTFSATAIIKEFQWIFAIVGVCFGCLGAVFLLHGKEYGEYYMAKKAMASEDPPYCTMQDKNFIKDERGIVWVWIVAILTWAIMAVAYFALAGIVYMVLDTIEGSYAYPQSFVDNISLTRDVTGWFLVIMTIGILGWALISSVRKVDDTMPAY